MSVDQSTARGEEIADQLTRATSELLAYVEPFTLAQWQTHCPNEARSAGVLVHHVALALANPTPLIVDVAEGRPFPPLTSEMIDHQNARHAEQYANVGQAETVALLRANRTTAVAQLRALTDTQLERTTTASVFGPAPVTAQQLTEFLLIGHTLGHLASIQAATAF